MSLEEGDCSKARGSEAGVRSWEVSWCQETVPGQGAGSAIPAADGKGHREDWLPEPRVSSAQTLKQCPAAARDSKAGAKCT